MTDHQATMEGPPPREESFVDKAINGALAAYASPGFWPGVAIALGISACYWSLFMGLPDLWDSPDGYYSHGFLVPFISAYIVGKNWEKLRERPVAFGWAAIPFFLLNLFVLRAAFAADLVVLLSFSLVATLLLTTWLLAGWKWMTGLALPILYLLFALPIWTFAIEVYTNPLQRTSTGVAFSLLKLLGFNPMRDQASTTIFLDHFTLDVGVPCSGFKLIIAVTAFTVFFTLIANLRWISNLVMFGMIIPLGLFINGLRVAMIGMVGDSFGADAGMAFHDWSGYITLLICFFILFKIARGLGWKD